MERPSGDEVMVRGFTRYIEQVAQELGIPEGKWAARDDGAWEAYVGIPELELYPGREVALVWTPDEGWALAVETGSGEDMILAGYLGSTRVPPPSAVRAFMDRLRHDGGALRTTPARGTREDALRAVADYGGVAGGVAAVE
ncbi:DUF6292 family protein [Rhodococcus sp. HM1]|uniref:DUF6292 family protein n=1 Tax=unclassified Rhodococcus (in: high G+C Gram-positive bacteria) TaxID=192944 RepID=UPI0018CE52DA|nr:MULTISPECIES: DUF6292 family protein [unclassified Rhodococcus (in: high G+C Gram-positive bacteria)]MBH0122263.1 hypothetical protein [Rhodococcus sp. CX]MCK8669886.1 DUF6292 family protein [Rhodococcus sp. HM1]